MRPKPGSNDVVTDDAKSREHWYCLSERRPEISWSLVSLPRYDPCEALRKARKKVPRPIIYIVNKSILPRSRTGFIL